MSKRKKPVGNVMPDYLSMNPKDVDFIVKSSTDADGNLDLEKVKKVAKRVERFKRPTTTGDL